MARKGASRNQNRGKRVSQINTRKNVNKKLTQLAAAGEQLRIEKAKKAARQVTRRATKAIEQAQHYIDENPRRAVMAAAGAGAVIGAAAGATAAYLMQQRKKKR